MDTTTKIALPPPTKTFSEEGSVICVPPPQRAKGPQKGLAFISGQKKMIGLDVVAYPASIKSHVNRVWIEEDWTKDFLLKSFNGFLYSQQSVIIIPRHYILAWDCVELNYDAYYLNNSFDDQTPTAVIDPHEFSVHLETK